MEIPTNASMAPNKGAVRAETVPVDSLRCYQSMNPKMYMGVAKGSAFLLACGLVCALWALLIYSLFDSSFWGRELLNQFSKGAEVATYMLIFFSTPFCLIAISYFFGITKNFVLWIRTCVMVSEKKLIFGDGYVKVFVALSGVDYQQAKYLVFDMDGISEDDNHICFTKPMFNLNDLQFQAFFERYQFINLTDDEIIDYGRRSKKLYYEPFLNSYIYGRNEPIFYRNALFE